MKNNKTLIAIIAIVVLLIVLGCLVKVAITGNLIESNTKSSTSNSSGATEITEESTVIDEGERHENVDYSNYTAKIDLSSLTVDGDGVSISGTTITITKEGIYYFTGTLEDGNIVVNASDDENVTLYMVNPKAPCIIKNDDGFKNTLVVETDVDGNPLKMTSFSDYGDGAKSIGQSNSPDKYGNLTHDIGIIKDGQYSEIAVTDYFNNAGIIKK